MKAFWLERDEDVSGTSGTGRVAEGVVFSNGWCALHWLAQYTSVAFYQSIAELEAIHGHSGKTRVVFGAEIDGAYRPRHARPLDKTGLAAWLPEAGEAKDGGVEVEFGYRPPEGTCPSFFPGTTPEQAAASFKAKADRRANDKQRLLAELTHERDKLQRRIAELSEEARRHAVHGEGQ
jgi:hypothetical protein